MTETKDLDRFISSWKEEEGGTKTAFIALKQRLEQNRDVTVFFKARPAISYSLRARRNGQEKELFVMVDVIDDDPDNRWLSVCFYKEMITDPDGLGDLVPGGLLGEDGYCFDIEPGDTGMVEYVMNRIDEAYRTAA